MTEVLQKKKGRIPKGRKRVNIENGFIIRNARLSLGLTMESLAERLYVGKQAVYNWEHGLCAPSADYIPALESVLGLARNTIRRDDVDNETVLIKINATCLREGRKTKRLTQRELALRIGVSKAAVSNYECGRNGFTLAVRQKLENELNISLLK